MILRYELRSQRFVTAYVPADFDVDAWKRQMVDGDMMTAKQAKLVECIRVIPAV